MDQQLSERSRARFGLVGCAVLLIAAAGAAVAVVPPSGGSTRLHATFERAGQGLDPGRSAVKVRGVPVGTVERVDLDRAGRASVRFRIDDAVRVPATATARIEPLSLFGPKDLALDLHDGDGPHLRDGGTVRRTAGTEELADLADPAHRLVRAIDPDDVTTLLHTLASGLASQGPTLRRTIGNTAAVIDASHHNRAVLLYALPLDICTLIIDICERR
ncbi:MlaD family protein [Spirillospora sp. CA-294931]|uniref:MlaD family protein n=1 Tax=Spirillospora sp. CA-294931 TaxID=3240042 RepID=UPI003D92B022